MTRKLWCLWAALCLLWACAEPRGAVRDAWSAHGDATISEVPFSQDFPQIKKSAEEDAPLEETRPLDMLYARVLSLKRSLPCFSVLSTTCAGNILPLPRYKRAVIALQTLP